MSRFSAWLRRKQSVPTAAPLLDSMHRLPPEIVGFYDAMDNYDEISGSGWLGPYLSFGLVYPHLRPGCPEEPHSPSPILENQR